MFLILLSQNYKYWWSNMIKESSSLIHPPFQLVIGPRREGGALDDLAHLLTTEAEVVDGPHVRELHHFDLAKEKTFSTALSTMRSTVLV